MTRIARGRRLSRYEARQVRSLVEDGGWSAKELHRLVRAGFGEPDVLPPLDETLEDERRATARAFRILSGADAPPAFPKDEAWEARTHEFHAAMQSTLHKIEEA